MKSFGHFDVLVKIIEKDRSKWHGLLYSYGIHIDMKPSSKLLLNLSSHYKGHRGQLWN